MPAAPVSVYEFAALPQVPADRPVQLVIDESEDEFPYTLTIHLRREDLNLIDLAASGRMRRLRLAVRAATPQLVRRKA